MASMRIMGRMSKLLNGTLFSTLWVSHNGLDLSSVLWGGRGATLHWVSSHPLGFLCLLLLPFLFLSSLSLFSSFMTLHSIFYVIRCWWWNCVNVSKITAKKVSFFVKYTDSPYRKLASNYTSCVCDVVQTWQLTWFAGKCMTMGDCVWVVDSRQHEPQQAHPLAFWIAMELVAMAQMERQKERTASSSINTVKARRTS